jgi:S-adenosylmethionine:tRNA ribosyltransferase-isomerase
LTPDPYRTADFDYDLPPELIAQEPLPDRGGSRLLVVRRSRASADGLGPSLSDACFSDLPQLIPAGDLVVINTSRVRHARLLGSRPSGRPAEVLLIQPGPEGTWTAMGQPGTALRPGKRIHLGDDAWVETLEVLASGQRLIRFIGISAEEAMRRYGRLPLPPYIRREPSDLDELRYQTVYAEAEGSVAAPTAGLHFTPRLLERLRSSGVMVEGLDLQVGPGTFKPVEVDDPSRHEMHPERYEISARLARCIAETQAAGGRIWAVGTTVVRALESAANPDGVIAPRSDETRLMILPGYTFRVVDRLITNFHLPRSTLLMLVCAFAGRELALNAYRHAVNARYRFYSYGDAMVII